ncbi:MAG: hypothetical protein JSR34_03750 [Proteobacteria bacterium]|nr:hypothetical protein [Pseudomonadota bacterium]
MKVFLIAALASVLAAGNAMAANASSSTAPAGSLNEANTFSIGAGSAAQHAAKPTLYAQAVGSQSCHDDQGKVVPCSGTQNSGGGSGVSPGLVTGLAVIAGIGIAIGMSGNDHKTDNHTLSRP